MTIETCSKWPNSLIIFRLKHKKLLIWIEKKNTIIIYIRCGSKVTKLFFRTKTFSVLSPVTASPSPWPPEISAKDQGFRRLYEPRLQHPKYSRFACFTPPHEVENRDRRRLAPGNRVVAPAGSGPLTRCPELLLNINDPRPESLHYLKQRRAITVRPVHDDAKYCKP